MFKHIICEFLKNNKFMLITTLKTELNCLITTDLDNINERIKIILNKYNSYECKNKRSFEDFEIIDDNNIYKIDINVYDINKSISFPSLLSIQRAKYFLSNNNNHIIYIFIGHKNNTITKIDVQNIESLDWNYLSIQNLGKGQIQMKNISPDKLTFNNDINRKEWLYLLNKKGSEYYDKLILKITEYKTKWNNELDN